MKRNRQRFHEDFKFQITLEENAEMVAIATTLSNSSFYRKMKQVRYNRMRNFFVVQKKLTIQLDKVSRKVVAKDEDIQKLFEILRNLVPKKHSPMKHIGYKP